MTVVFSANKAASNPYILLFSVTRP